MFPAFGLSVYERDKMADYSSAWRVITRIVTDYFFITKISLCHEDISFVTRRVTDDLFVPNYQIIEFFFTRRIADGHGGFICHEFANLRIVLHTENCGWSRRISLSRISELFFTRMVTESHGGFLWHETFTLDILNNGKEFVN